MIEMILYAATVALEQARNRLVLPDVIEGEAEEVLPVAQIASE